MATAIVSALTDIAVRRDVAMTGEITLRGRVLLISGLKGKLLAKLYRGGHPRPPNFMRFPRRNAARNLTSKIGSPLSR